MAGPILLIWESEFNRQHTSIQVGYVPTNSGEGIRQITLQQGDFAIGEIPLTPEQLRNSGVHLTQLPIAVVAVVPVYNVPGQRHLRFTGELLAQIYMGKIANWNDSRIAAVNQEVALPDLPIVTVQRSEGSGTRYIFGQYLSKSSREFQAWMKASEHRKWGAVVTSKSSDMAEKVALTPGAIGFVERSIAERQGIASGGLQNRAGKYVEATAASIGAACAVDEFSISDGFRESMIDAKGADSYPLISFAWAYLPASGLATARRDALEQFLGWSLTDGQVLLGSHDYYPLPVVVAKQARSALQAAW